MRFAEPNSLAGVPLGELEQQLLASSSAVNIESPRQPVGQDDAIPR
jgi:hypothetical protein